jgi:hypothetical protein
MWNFLGKVNRNLVLAIPAMMAAGFLSAWRRTGARSSN